MAKKAEQPELVDRFAEFKELKNIDKNSMIEVLRDSFYTVLKKNAGEKSDFSIIMNPDTGDAEIYQIFQVVEDGQVENPVCEMSLSDARQLDPECEVGEPIEKQIFFEKFGRRAILNLRQTLQGKILEMQKQAIADKFRELKGEIVSGEVHNIWKNEMLLVDNDNHDMIMPKKEQIKSDFFHKGDIVRAVVKEVEDRNNNPKVILSRTDNEFLKRLFEEEVAEIRDGLITIQAVAREPGVRAKVAVESYDDRIDPVGSCVGVGGQRIRNIVRELRNENIDVISYTSNPQLFIQRALSPAKVSEIRIDQENKKAEVFLHPDEVSLAIGKGGLNIKLACMLTGYTIDVYRDLAEGEEDIYLDEFRDEIDDWVIEALKNLGLGTAKEVLNASPEMLEQADLEDETLQNVLDVLRAEFEE